MDLRDEFIGRVAQGASFADIGGLWGTVNEKVSVAHRHGAGRLAMIDVSTAASPWWTAFEERRQTLGVPPVECVSADIVQLTAQSHHRQYDVVHCCCFPHVSVLACRLGLLAHPRTRLVVDWHEVLPRATWRRRLGALGDAGWAVQRLAVAATPVALTFSELHARRLRAEGYGGRVEVVPEFLPDGEPVAPAVTRDATRLVFAGRLVREKHPAVVPAVVAALRRTDPRWHAVVLGDGPETDAVLAAAGAAGVADGVDVRGYVPPAELAAALGTATVLLHPSEREGFGLAVLEALAYGLPVVVVAAPDNAAVELVVPGVNGVVCADGGAESLAAAVLEVARLHAATEAWWAAHAGTYTLAGCAARLRAIHETLVS